MNIGKIEIPLGSISGLNTTSSAIITGAAVAGQTTIWSNSFNLMASTAFGVMALCQGNNPQIQIQLEQSFYSLPLNGVAQGASNSFWVIPDAFPDVFPLIADNNWHIISNPLTPIPMTHARFKVNGLANNGSGVNVVIVLFRQEPGRFL